MKDLKYHQNLFLNVFAVVNLNQILSDTFAPQFILVKKSRGAFITVSVHVSCSADRKVHYISFVLCHELNRA